MDTMTFAQFIRSMVFDKPILPVTRYDICNIVPLTEVVVVTDYYSNFYQNHGATAPYIGTK